jgi:hypothetical protein
MFLPFVTQTLRAARGDVTGRSRASPDADRFRSAALRKIDIFFDERRARSTNYRALSQKCVRASPFYPFGISWSTGCD